MATATTSRKSDIALLDLIADAEAAYRKVPELSLQDYFSRGMSSSSESERQSIMREAADASREQSQAIAEVMEGFQNALRALLFGRDFENFDPGLRSTVELTLELALENSEADDFARIAKNYARFAEFAGKIYQNGRSDRGRNL